MLKLKTLSIGTSILIAITVIIGSGLLLSSYINYNIFFGTTNEVVESTSKEINKQIIMNYENYIDRVIDIANYLQTETVELSKTNEIDRLNSSYLYVTQIDKSVVSIVMFDSEGNPLYSNLGDEIFVPNISDKSWYRAAYTDSNIFHFSSPHTQDIYFGGNKEVITVTKVVDYYDNGISRNGVLAVELDMSNFIDLSEKTNLGEYGHIVILNEYNDLIYSSGDVCQTEDCQSLEIANDIIIGGDFVKVDNIDMYVNVNTLQHTRWSIATFINVESINDAKQSAILTLFGAFAIVFAVTFTASSTISSRISSPLNKLKSHMELFRKGDFHTKVHVTGQKEVVILADAYNLMIDEIRELMNEVLSEQNAKRKTQFKALQNQINPHFLYNTLDSIVWLSENKKNDDVEKMVIALSKFFRISISNETSLISVGEEIEHVKNYLLIQQIRYNKRFTYDFEIDEKFLKTEILKLSLQPLVENAIYHGISPEDEYSRICVKVFEEDGLLKVSVSNEGYGLTDERIQEIYDTLTNKVKTKSIGLKNVYQRLKLYYGDSADLIISSVPDEETTVTMIFPIVKEDTKT